MIQTTAFLLASLIYSSVYLFADTGPIEASPSPSPSKHHHHHHSTNSTHHHHHHHKSTSTPLVNPTTATAVVVDTVASAESQEEEISEEDIAIPDQLIPSDKTAASQPAALHSIEASISDILGETETISVKSVLKKLDTLEDKKAADKLATTLGDVVQRSDDIVGFMKHILDDPEAQLGKLGIENEAVLDEIYKTFSFIQNVVDAYNKLSPEDEAIFLDRANAVFADIKSQIKALESIDTSKKASIPQISTAKSSNDTVAVAAKKPKNIFKRFASSVKKDIVAIAHKVSSLGKKISSNMRYIAKAILPSKQTRSKIDHKIAVVLHKTADVNSKVVHLIQRATAYNDQRTAVLQTFVGILGKATSLAGGAAGIAATAYPPIAAASIPLSIAAGALTLTSNEMPLIMHAIDKTGQLNALIGDLLSGAINKMAARVDQRSEKLANAEE